MRTILRSLLLGWVATSALVGCTELKHATPEAANDPGDPEDAEPAEEAEGDADGDRKGDRSKTKEPRAPEKPNGPIDEGGKPAPTLVEELVTGRSRLGARSHQGFRPWRSGLAVHDGRLYWVEGGTQPGIYSAPVTCKSESCVDKLAKLTRPASFTATDTAIWVADTNVLKKLEFAPGSELKTVASHSNDIVNLAVSGKDVFWTAGSSSAIQWTNGGGSTSTPIYSNGTPVGMAVAGSRVFWVGVDISGLNGLLQSVKTDGTGARGVADVAGGFHAMGGNDTYLYYAKGRPAAIHRLTVATGRDEVVAEDALGVAEIVLDATHAYWVEPGDGPDFLNGQVRRVAHDSTEPETLAVSVVRPIALAVAPKRVYVASAGTPSADWNDGKILQISLP